jgi:hypothetical protein
VVLPEANSGRVLIYPPTERPPEEFKLLHVLPELGDYPGVLAYRMGLTPAENMGTTEILLWDRIIIIQGFAFDGVWASPRIVDRLAPAQAR